MSRARSWAEAGPRLPHQWQISRPPIAGAGGSAFAGDHQVRAQKSEWMAGEVAFSEAGQRRVVNFSGVIVGGKVGSSVELVGTIIHDPKWGDQFKIRDGRTIGVVESGESGVTPPQRHDVIKWRRGFQGALGAQGQRLRRPPAG